MQVLLKNKKGNSSRPKLLEQVRQKMRVAGYSPKTIDAYIKWINEFIFFNNTRPPENLGKEEVEKFLTYLAVKRNVSASTQNQALSAILYLYKNIVKKEIGWLNDVVRAHKSRRMPVVFTKEEVRKVFNFLEGAPKLVCSLIYGSGLRLGEALRLRILEMICFRNEKSKKYVFLYSFC